MDKKTKRESFRRVFFKNFASENIVLVQALGLCPIITAGTSLQRGVALTVCMLAALIPGNLLMSAIGKRLHPAARAPIYTVLAIVLVMACGWFMAEFVSPELYASLYIFLPLMSINTIFVYHSGAYSVGRHPLLALTDAVGTAAGFGVVICAVSAFREMAISGTLWGVPLGFSARFPEAAYPFAAFILLGFMAAILQQIKNYKSHGLEEEEVLSLE